jgi:hypothetical protein
LDTKDSAPPPSTKDTWFPECCALVAFQF